MNLPDEEMLRRLLLRDGPLPERYSAHNARGDCRYAEDYAGQVCPWCAAAERRRAREGPKQATT